jgi:MFS family permease
MSSARRDPLFTRAFVLAFVAHFLHALSYNLYLHLPGLLIGYGADEQRIGTIMGCAGATALVARPALGRAIDDRGRRPVAIAGGFVGIVACSSYLLVDGIGPLLYGLRLAHGLSEAMLFASLFAMVADIVPASRRIEGIGLFGVSGLLPIALGGLVGDAVLAAGSFSLLFEVAATCSAIGTALSFLLPETRTVEGEPPRGVLAALFQRDLGPVWLAGLGFAMALAPPFTFAKTLVLERPSLGAVGPFFGAYTVGAVGVRVLGARLPERIGPKRALFPAMGIMTAGFVVVALAHAPTALLAGGLLLGMGHGWLFPILTSFVVVRARAQERGAALSVYTGLFDAGFLIGAPTFGWIARTSQHGAMFLATAGLTIASALGFAAWDARVGEPRRVGGR